MAHSLSAKKRIRQNAQRRARNQARKSLLNTKIRKFDDALRVSGLSGAERALRDVTKNLDKLSTTSALHRNTAARKKSRLAKRLNATKTANAT